MSGRWAAGALLIIAAAAACGVGKSDAAQRENELKDTLTARDSRLEDALAKSDSTEVGAALARWLLPKDLNEISGLALTPDGRLLAHDDRRGIVSEIDYRRGVLVKQFKLGKETLLGDFEGITVAHGRVFLMTSEGVLYEFEEGADGTRVEYTMHDTKLKRECEFEGIVFDAAINSLVLVCKNVSSKKTDDVLVMFRWDLGSGDGQQASRIEIPLAAALGEKGWKELSPSDITKHPRTGNYLIVAAQQKALIEVTPDGKLVDARPLPGEHMQAEGLAITPDGILIVADEAGASTGEPAKRPTAAISLFRWS